MQSSPSSFTRSSLFSCLYLLFPLVDVSTMLIIYVTPIYLIIRLPGYEVASLALSRVAIFVILLFWAIQLLRRGLDESSNKRGVVAFGVVSFIGLSKHRRVLECCPELTSHWFSRFHPDHDPCTNPPRSSVSRFQDLPGKSLLHRGRRAMDILGCFLYWSVPAYPTVFFEKKKKTDVSNFSSL